MPLLLTQDPEQAAARLLAGGLVGLPTETVYGLAADAEAVAAVARVYAVKGRPADHPLIVHVADAGALDPDAGWVSRVPAYAQRLAAQLWPGPLTLVLARGPRAGDHVTGGQATIALRAPAHPMAQAVLAAAGRHRDGGIGLAAPSANRFGRVSPTTAAHVIAELGRLLDDDRDLVLDGGPCRVGVESTIIDCSGRAPVLLRPGDIGPDRITRVGGVAPTGGSRVRVPGSLASHYAPLARVSVIEASELAQLPASVGLLADARLATPPGVVRLAAPNGPVEYAHALYRALREADALALTRVVAVLPIAPANDPASDGLLAAIGDRLRRATHATTGAQTNRSALTP